MNTRRFGRRRTGNILLLSAIMMIGMLAMLAMAVDVGYLCLARDQLQRSADAAAIAAAWELVDEAAVRRVSDGAALPARAAYKANEYAALNPVLRDAPQLGSDDVDVGYLANPSNRTLQLDTTGVFTPNAVRVRVRRTADQNGEVPFFIARFLGIDSMATEAEATAALLTSIRGFQVPTDRRNVDLLPFAMDLDTWCDMLQGVGTDQWRWDEATGRVLPGADGILEVNLYPQGTGSPGNRGTVDIGSNSNSTADIARQIVHGVSPQDLEHHGGKLELDAQGQLGLNGDTGISAGVKDELNSIRGQKRIIPLFSSVAGPGNNAQYTIVRFAGIRIMEVDLTGKSTSKRVIIQPATVKARGSIPSSNANTSHFVYSPVWLVR